MAVAVQQPGRRKRDPIDLILTGLGVANQVYGIKANMEKADALKQQQEFQRGEIERQRSEKERIQSGIRTPGEIQQLQLQGAKEVPQGTKGAIEVPVQTAEGTAPKFFISPKAAEIERNATAMAEKIAKEKKASISKRADSLRKEYDKASEDTFDALQAYKKVEAAATGDPTGANDVALVFNFMKTIDPGSVVREGEFATAENTVGVPDRIRNQYNNILKGNRLGAPQRAQFLESAREQINSQLQIQKDTDERFSRLAEIAEVDNERVINPIFSNLSSELQNQIQQQNQALSQQQQVPSTFDIVPKATAAPKEPTAREQVMQDPDIKALLGE